MIFVRVVHGSVRQLEVYGKGQVPPLELYAGILARWLRYESREYYRLTFKKADESVAAVQYRPAENAGSIYVSADATREPFGRIDGQEQPWDEPIGALKVALVAAEAGNGNA